MLLTVAACLLAMAFALVCLVCVCSLPGYADAVRDFNKAAAALRVAIGLEVVSLGRYLVGPAPVPPVGLWSCTRCGDNEHQAKAKACGRSPCPMAPTADIVGLESWTSIGNRSPVVERAAMFQGASPRRVGCLPDCPCMTRGKVTPNQVRAARLAAGHKADQA